MRYIFFILDFYIVTFLLKRSLIGGGWRINKQLCFVLQSSLTAISLCKLDRLSFQDLTQTQIARHIVLLHEQAPFSVLAGNLPEHKSLLRTRSVRVFLHIYSVRRFKPLSDC